MQWATIWHWWHRSAESKPRGGLHLSINKPNQAISCTASSRNLSPSTASRQRGVDCFVLFHFFHGVDELASDCGGGPAHDAAPRRTTSSRTAVPRTAHEWMARFVRQLASTDAYKRKERVQAGDRGSSRCQSGLAKGASQPPTKRQRSGLQATGLRAKTGPTRRMHVRPQRPDRNRRRRRHRRYGKPAAPAGGRGRQLGADC